MADLDDLIKQIPVADIANKLGANEGEVNSAIKTLVPALVGSIQQNVQTEDIDSSELESAVSEQGASGLLDGGVSIDQVDEQAGERQVARIFGGNDTSQVATALSNAGAGSNNLLQKLLPIITPIVLAYIGKKLLQGGSAQPAPQASQSGGGLGDILGSILGGGSQKSDNPLGGILGSVLGGDKGGGLGDILGGLIRGQQ
ncbi:MAG TPA: DUF937 domain-containing protein [Mycobacterium sp.]|nr:DUF937 domain-containing protein [Mycobacterium sp.]